MNESNPNTHHTILTLVTQGLPMANLDSTTPLLGGNFEEKRVSLVLKSAPPSSAIYRTEPGATTNKATQNKRR